MVHNENTRLIFPFFLCSPDTFQTDPGVFGISAEDSDYPTLRKNLQIISEFKNLVCGLCRFCTIQTLYMCRFLTNKRICL